MRIDQTLDKPAEEACVWTVDVLTFAGWNSENIL